MSTVGAVGWAGGSDKHNATQRTPMLLTRRVPLLASRPCAQRLGAPRPPRPAVHCSAVEQPQAGEQPRSLDVHTQLRKLQSSLDEAVVRQDFPAAAALKRQLDALEESDDELRTRRQLQAAIADERYEVAAKLKAQLQALEASKQAEEDALLASSSGSVESLASKLSTMSERTSHGIRVKVRSQYQPASSSRSHYFFSYTVSIYNESNDVMQLRNRHWIITDDLEDTTEEVRGAGVLGKQPVLLPGASFEYTSGCPLQGRTGHMRGTYQFAVLDSTTGLFLPKLVEVAIGAFKLQA